jgi:N utilization substance protein B
MLFVIEFHDRDDIEEQAVGYIEGIEECTEKDATYMLTKLKNIVKVVDDIDKVIEEASANWKLSRMNKVDLTVLRLAVYEIQYDEDIPNKVAVNEAVEIAKKFGGDSSPSFVNGILAKVI